MARSRYYTQIDFSSCYRLIPSSYTEEEGINFLWEKYKIKNYDKVILPGFSEKHNFRKPAEYYHSGLLFEIYEEDKKQFLDIACSLSGEQLMAVFLVSYFPVFFPRGGYMEFLKMLLKKAELREENPSLIFHLLKQNLLSNTFGIEINSEVDEGFSVGTFLDANSNLFDYQEQANLELMLFFFIECFPLLNLLNRKDFYEKIYFNYEYFYIGCDVAGFLNLLQEDAKDLMLNLNFLKKHYWQRIKFLILENAISKDYKYIPGRINITYGKFISYEISPFLSMLRKIWLNPSEL